MVNTKYQDGAQVEQTNIQHTVRKLQWKAVKKKVPEVKMVQREKQVPSQLFRSALLYFQQIIIYWLRQAYYDRNFIKQRKRLTVSIQGCAYAGIQREESIKLMDQGSWDIDRSTGQMFLQAFDCKICYHCEACYTECVEIRFPKIQHQLHPPTTAPKLTPLVSLQPPSTKKQKANKRAAPSHLTTKVPLLLADSSHGNQAN